MLSHAARPLVLPQAPLATRFPGEEPAPRQAPREAAPASQQAVTSAGSAEAQSGATLPGPNYPRLVTSKLFQFYIFKYLTIRHQILMQFY